MTTTQTLTARERRVAHVAEMAAKNLKDHVIEERHIDGMYRCWRCGVPGNSTYHFRVATIPGVMLVTGDMGTLVIERAEDMVAWAAGSVRSLDYFASKVPREIPTEEYDEDVAKEVIAEIRRRIGGEENDDCPEVMVAGRWLTHAEMVTRFDDYLGNVDTSNEHETAMAIYESGFVDGCDFPSLKNYRYHFLWIVEALKWFTSHLQEPAA